MLLTGCGNQTGSADQATGSDAADFSGLTTEVAEVITEEATTEATLEVVANEDSRPEAVPATTEIGGGKKKAEETTEEKKPNATESTKPSTNHSNNSGSASSGQSTAPKPSNNGSNSGNSGSDNGGNSNSTPSTKPSTPATTEAPTTQHQHNYNVWVKPKMPGMRRWLTLLSRELIILSRDTMLLLLNAAYASRSSSAMKTYLLILVVVGPVALHKLG